MKTLYESIIQSRFGDHKIEESILDNDIKIMNRADKKAAAYLERKKKIDLVLDAFEELALNWGLKFSHDADFGSSLHINSKNSIARYFSKRNKTNASKQEFMDGYKFLKDKFTSIWSECIPEENLLLNSPSASFVFKDLGIKVWISLDKRSNTLSSYNETFLMICFDKNNKYVEDVINKLVKKTS